MKTIGIITILKCNNFGAELQACATQRVLASLGYDAEIIDYLYFKNPGHKAIRLSAPIAPQSVKQKFINFIKYTLATKVLYRIVPMFSSKLRNRNNKFDKFHLDNTKMSDTYRSMDNLYNSQKRYDVYLVGSDQVWNPFTESNLAPFFLQFAPQNAKKISYASSFGVSELPDFAKGIYSKWLRDFNHISCRENAGVKLVEGLTGRKASMNLDPTLLLTKEQWLEVDGCDPLPQKGYVLIYEVRPSAYIHRMAREYASKNNLEIYRLCLQAVGNKKDEGIINIDAAGPADFVHLFAGASYVLTNSFHGTAFACNFGRNFNTVLFKANKKNSRMTSLLETLCISDRIVYEEDCFPNSYGGQYDVEKTQRLLEAERAKSLEYLKNAIEN